MINEDQLPTTVQGTLSLMPSTATEVFRQTISTYVGRHRLEQRFLDKVMPEPNTGCWIWCAHLDAAGYGRFSVGREGISLRSHMVSFELYKEPIKQGLFICHKCDNPFCVNPDHLFMGTAADNMHDRDKKGRCQKRESHYRAKFSDVDVKIMREAYAAGFKTVMISNYFNISSGHACNILHNKTRKHG